MVFRSSTPVSSRLAVGPEVIFSPEVRPPSKHRHRLIVIGWNTHVGRGNIVELAEEMVRRERMKGFDRPEFVFLLQETFRRGGGIPAPGKARMPRRISPRTAGSGIEDIARQLGWWMYYAPSMRNGRRHGEHAEDRGNAILSTRPLTDLKAIELPFAVHRRVALVATVTDDLNNPILRVVAAHFDTRAHIRKGWLFGGPSARNRQAEAMVEAVTELENDGLPLIVGADVNSHLGSREAAVQTVSKLAAPRHCNRPTHRSGLVLDYIFARLPHHWKAGHCLRLDSTFGSDHYPLMLPIDCG